MNKVSRKILSELDKTKVKFQQTEENEPLQKGQAGGAPRQAKGGRSPAGPRKEVVSDEDGTVGCHYLWRAFDKRET